MRKDGNAAAIDELSENIASLSKVYFQNLHIFQNVKIPIYRLDQKTFKTRRAFTSDGGGGESHPIHEKLIRTFMCVQIKGVSFVKHLLSSDF